MSNNIVEVQDIFDSAEKYGEDNILNWNPTKFRDLKTKNTSSKFDCTWIPIKFKFADGSEAPMSLKFTKVMTASGAKLSNFSDKDVIKNMTIAFKEHTREEIATGDNVPKKKATPEEQAIENKRIEDKVDKLFKSTNDFDRALAIIDKSYHKICEELKAAKGLKFTIKKKKGSAVTVNSIRQVSREDKENPNGDLIQLDKALTRIKLMLGKNGDVGVDVWNNESRSWDSRYNVYDSRKSTSKNGHKQVLAKVQVNGEWHNVNKDNAEAFITRGSIVGGTIDFKDISASVAGLSLSNQFRDIHVKRNTKAGKIDIYSVKDKKELGCDSSDEEDADKFDDDMINGIDNIDIDNKSDLDVDTKKAPSLDNSDDAESENSAFVDDDA
jgi:hypothetical protein